MKRPSDWYYQNTLARELSQLTEREYRKFADSELFSVTPVILPTVENIVGENDYFMWPIAAMIEGTIVVLYQRTPCHWGPDLEKSDGQGGIRMVVTSSDGGLTWTEPVDVLESGQWPSSPFAGFGGGLGVHEGVVYLALKQGVYQSKDKGLSWALVSADPVFDQVCDVLWAPGMRITFDQIHGLTIWTTSGFAEEAAVRKERGAYGTHMVAVYSPDFGVTWKSESQALPEGLRLSEVTPVDAGGTLAFFLRNGLNDTRFGQGYSGSKWFPFHFDLSNVGPVALVDTPDINYNPVTGRFEVAAPHRRGEGPGPTEKMKVNLYSIDPADLAQGSTEWRYDGTLLCYRDQFGISDGFNIVGSLIDVDRGMKHFHVWGGDCTGKAGIFQYSVSLDTPAVSQYLMRYYDRDRAHCESN
ncbi:MAG: exo-alpha-sialidase [Candidatus Latescibacteria bacterium]|nr:exo-alpha-sialidase [Candidatus Latescibacterota bacterium]